MFKPNTQRGFNQYSIQDVRNEDNGDFTLVFVLFSGQVIHLTFDTMDCPTYRELSTACGFNKMPLMGKLIGRKGAMLILDPDEPFPEMFQRLPEIQVVRSVGRPQLRAVA